MTIICAVLFIVPLSSCSKDDSSSENESAQPILTFSAEDVKEIQVSTTPEVEDFSKAISSAEGIEEIIGYINGIGLETDYDKNPDEFAGVTTNMIFKLSDGKEITVCQLGNKFLRVDENRWYQITVEDGQAISDLILKHN